MRRLCVFVWRLSVAGLMGGAACIPAQNLDAARPPGGNFDLTHWYLGLPVDSSGGTTGTSASVSAAQLVAGYSNALYFYTGADGAMTFWAPVDGATTSGSSYPRSELREQISPPSNDINWSGYGTYLLEAQCRVLEVSSTRKVIIGQIHSKTGEARPLVKLQYNDGVIEALIKNSPTANPDTRFVFQNVGLSNLVHYQLMMVDGLVTVSVNGSNRSMNVFQSDPEWADQRFYFKAGSYCQDNVGPSAEGARVAFYSLSATHGVTNPPPIPGPTVTNLIVGDNKSASFKIPLMDLNDAGLAADLASSSGTVNPLYTNLPGYMVDWDVNTGPSANTSFREHVENTTGRFLGTTTGWNQISIGPDDGYGFVANTEYVGVFSITRTGTNSVGLFSSLSQGESLLTSHGSSYESAPMANHFGMLGFWVNSDTFRSTRTHSASQDNGITFANVRIELVTPVIPMAPTLDIRLSGANLVLSWPTNGTAGFQLESPHAMSPPG